jgi:hypothetical protein
MHLLRCCLKSEVPPNGKRQVDNAAWQEERRRSAMLWVGVWRALEASIDPNWSLHDPKLEINPYIAPTGVPFRGGMDPNDIQDPRVREEYRAHIVKNRRLTEWNKQQQTARKLIQEYRNDVEAYLVSLCTAPPANTTELQRLLATLKDEEMRTRILGTVERRALPH